nr:hypothetical protein BgiMline_014016 [Biomphalaria glabrata]
MYRKFKLEVTNPTGVSSICSLDVRHATAPIAKKAPRLGEISESKEDNCTDKMTTGKSKCSAKKTMYPEIIKENLVTHGLKSRIAGSGYVSGAKYSTKQ